MLGQHNRWAEIAHYQRTAPLQISICGGDITLLSLLQNSWQRPDIVGHRDITLFFAISVFSSWHRPMYLWCSLHLKLDITDFHESLSRNSKFWYNRTKTSRTLHEKRGVFSIVDSDVRKATIQTTCCCASAAKDFVIYYISDSRISMSAVKKARIFAFP